MVYDLYLEKSNILMLMFTKFVGHVVQFFVVTFSTFNSILDI